jgi:glycerol-3-phosphate acyltransferase PlsY
VIDKNMSALLTIAALSYLLGSIPFGYLLVRIFRGEDVRLSGSGNIGATNVSRKSPLLGVATLLLDATKGTAAVWLARLLWNGKPGVPIQLAMAAAMLFAVVGHMFPVWLKFRGGKGAAAGLGSMLILAPKSALLAVGIFIVVVLVFRYVSLASIVAALGLPFLVFAFGEHAGATQVLTMIGAASLLIVYKHHENIGRLLAGTENRIGSSAQREPPTKSKTSSENDE